ncbi:MAG: type III-B CRISPR module RAMP protein Cmr4 [Desulfobacterales bacterium]|nr:type III-B CRISPR module RAMP protein Cmr4 [Desulfobacterales bacterium]
MYTKGKLMFFYTESLVHAGAGEGVGAIDLPIQREKVTNWPIIHSSGIKGAMRDHFEAKKLKNDELFIVFGPDSQKKDSNNNPGNPGEHAGSIAFSDAKILLFPVRSLKGTFAYITCPLAITRFYRDILTLKSCGLDLIDNNLKEAITIAINLNDSILLPKIENSADILTVQLNNNRQSPKKVILEELMFNVEYKPEVYSFCKWLKSKWTDSPSWIDIDKRIAVVSDDVFKDFVEFSTEVLTRNRINDETGVAQTGALWNEECLPREVLLYSMVFASSPLKKSINNLLTDENVLDYITNKPNYTPDRIWLGGDQTIGRGIIKVHFI